MKTRRPRVSVIIPAFNAARLLPGCVASLQAQTLVQWEALIVDDASTDETLSVARTLAGADARVQVLALSRNQGPSAARNIGIEHAQGAYIALLDADDGMDPTRLERLWDAANVENADMVADNLWLVDPVHQGVTRPMFSATSGAAGAWTLERHFRQSLPNTGGYTGWFKPLMSLDFLNQHRLRYRPEFRYGEDFLFYAEALALGARAIILPTPGYRYTTRSSEFGLNRSSASRTVVDVDALLQGSDWFVEKYRSELSLRVLRRARFRRSQLALVPQFEQLKAAARALDVRGFMALIRDHPGLVWFLTRNMSRLGSYLKAWIGRRT